MAYSPVSLVNKGMSEDQLHILYLQRQLATYTTMYVNVKKERDDLLLAYSNLLVKESV